MASEAHKKRTAALLGGILLLLARAIVADVQTLPKPLEIRLRKLLVLSKESAGSECGELLNRIEEDQRLSPLQRARGLDRLRDGCTAKLAWADPLVVKMCEISVDLRRSLEKEEPAALCKALRDLGFSYHYLGRTQEAHKFYLEALAISHRWRGRGTSDENVAAAFESLSSTFLDLGNRSAALQAAEESLRLRREAVPFLLEKVVTALAVRARVEEQYDLKATRATLIEAHRLSQGLGPEHSSEAARVANNLGEILYRLGELPQAVTYLQEAERLRSRDQRTGCAVASTHSLLGQIFFDLGDYPQAENYHLKAVKEHVACWGKDPYRYGDALTGRAIVLEESGDWDGALALQLEALEIRKAASSRDPSDNELHLALARSFTRLGALQRRMGATEAKSSLERALAIQDRFLSDRASPDRAETLVELAEHWREAGSPERARPLVERCLRELGALGEQGPLLVRAMELSARIAADPAAGLTAIEQAGRQAQQLFGQGSPETATILRIRAELRRRQGNREGAFGDALASQKLSLPHVRTIVQAFPRDQALAFATDRHQSLDLALDLVAESPGLSPNVVAQAWQTAASNRMLVRDAEVDRQRLLRATADPRLSPMAKRLASARERFAYLLVQAHGTVETQAKRLQEARRELLDAEASFATKTRPLLASKAVTAPNIPEFRRRLPKGAALVAVFEYQQAVGSDAYLAFVLKGSGPAHAVALGKAATIDWLIQEWRAAILSPRADENARTRSGKALRRMIWDPIAPLLSGARTIFLVPDGSFYLVPFMALPAEEGGYLIEQDWLFHNLTAERDLLQQPEPFRPGPWLALGGVDYAHAATRLDALRGGKADDCKRGGLPSFTSLPGSFEEIQDLIALSQRLQTHPGEPKPSLTTLAGKGATEQALRQTVPGRRIVHLATHGFAMARHCGVIQPAIRGIGGLSLGAGLGRIEPSPLSGLVLAGANARGKALRSDQDGILTEDEILGLNLDAADWVVLSACETGLGRIRPGEGVVGMLRAFQIAGAKTVIVSLWSVRDQSARAWMHELYQARFERRLSTVEAVRQAALRRLRFYREQGDDNPAGWAGFMATGQWK